MSEDAEDDVRAYFGMESVKEMRRSRRRPRVSTDFSPDVYEDFRTIRDMLGLSNDEFLRKLLEQDAEFYTLQVKSWPGLT